MALVVSFRGAAQTPLSEVGGKGYWLIRLTEAGLPVPPGVVLTARFFSPWFEEIKASAAWTALAGAPREQWAALCAELKRLCPALRLTQPQQQALEQARERLAAPANGGLLAVRSSSPEEDLASASFAGGYESRLGVRPEELEEAVRRCFASALDERVLVYKEEHGFDVLSPRIAVVIQQQIDSEAAGVGFSLNPLTNDYDEAVIDANWGLGESVAAGLASPDHFVVDKVSRRVIERKPGAKQVAVWLSPDGGTVRRQGRRSAGLTLSDAQLGELTGALCRIEEFFGKPVDVEWAYAGGWLHVLQARPITTYVPLAPEMMTRPGERRRVYADAALSKGMTLNAPISPMGLDWIQETMAAFMEQLGATLRPDVPPEEVFVQFAGGRMYMNLSNVMWLSKPETIARSAAQTDALMAEILAAIDPGRYRSAKRPSWARLRTLLFLPKLLWRLRGFFRNTLWALVSPDRARREYQRKTEAFEASLTKDVDYSLPLGEFRRTCSANLVEEMFDVTMPALMASLVALEAVDLVVPRKPPEARALSEKLKRGFTGNVVVEMGIALFRLARMLERPDFEDLPRLAERVNKREMPVEFLRAWDEFAGKFGWRGPGEMDLASPRYADDPALALRQMSFMTVDDEGFDPEAAHQRHVEERRRAYEELLKRLGWLRRGLLRRVHRVIELFAGTRDTPKHHNLLPQYAIRRRVLIEGWRLAEEGRLDAAGHVFDLTFRDLETAGREPALDLRAVREERTRFIKTLAARVKDFPAVIDSRGRILRPRRREETPGELRGMAVSPGVVAGPVKVLHSPHEKPVSKGEVLVAYTTDPGWTPLFVNAAAVVLEVGGVLQHGAVIAREYGKPCVVGIEGIMSKLRDGQSVEVDGTAGIVRLLK